MASELRVNTSTNRVGLGTITYTDTGPIISGITTGNNFKTGTTNVHSTGVELANINTGGSTATFGGDLSIPDTIVHTGDTNTKIRFPAADTFSVETAGQQNVQVNGTRTLLKSPSGTNTTVRLQHQGNSGYGDIILDRQVNAFIIDNDPSNASNNQSYFSVKNKGTENLRILHDGKVGINQNTPTAQLQIGAPNTATGVLRADPGYFSIDSGYANGGSVGGVVGSATNPCLIFGGDGNTGLYHSASDTVNFATGGTERLRLDSTGRVLIGAGAIAAPKASVGGLDISSGLLSLVLGGEANTGNGTPRTNSVQKEARICVPHYTLAEEPTAAVVVFNSSSANRINIGGATGLCNSATDIRFFTAANTTTTSGTQRLRITSTGEVRIGDSSTTASTAGDDLVIEGSSDRGLSIISGSASSGNIYFGHSSDADEGRIAYQHNDNALDFSVNAGSTRFRIHQAGVYAYGNDNVFLGGTSGSNLNGELTIRSTGTAVYQHLRFKSSDGSSQSQVMGYGGGAILFHYSNEFVWAINNQGERLNLTNTSLKPRSSSTVLDLGTTGDRYRRTYTDGITVNTSNTNTNFCINGGSAAHVMTIRNTTGGNGNVGVLFSTQDHSGGREKAAIYHQETHGQAHYGGDFIFCLANSTGGAAQVGPSDERFRIKRNGFVDMTGASDVRFTLGSAGTAGTNDSNWVRGESGNIMYNAASANHIWETGGTKQMEISAGNLFLRSTGTRYIVLGSSGDSTSGGANNNMNWIRGNAAHVQYNTNGGFHGWEVGGSQKMIINANGTIGAPSGSNIYNGSDERLKENMVQLTDGLSKINQIEPISFTWKESWDPDSSTQYGFGAHQVKSVDETLVEPFSDEDIELDGETIDDPLRVNEKFIIPLLVKAVQELSAEVAALKSSINN